MRKNVALYIGGIRADLDDNALILMNYTQEDLQNPAIVKNSYSQQVTLKGTDVNNSIFSSYYRNDYETTTGFNALQKTPFIIYSAMGEKLEEGYCKLDSVEKSGNNVSYKVSLYGGLGGFLYSLMYDSDGEKLTLADLTYTSGGDSSEFNFKITKDAVRNAWRKLMGQNTGTIWDCINFAPCYNGLPGGNFASDKAFCPDSVFGVTNTETVDGVTYNSHSGNTLVTLSGKKDEWATKDLRSYLQRPVINVKKIFAALQTYASDNGYTVTLDSDFFNVSNKFYEYTWMTLPRLDSIEIPIESGQENTLYTFDLSTGDSSYSVTLTYGDLGAATQYHFLAQIQPRIKFPSNQTESKAYSMAREVSAVYAYRNLQFFQLLAYDADGNVVGGSNVACASSNMINHSVYPETLTTLEALQLVGQANPAYTPTWNPNNNLEDIAGTMYLGTYISSVGQEFANWTGGNIVLECDALNVYRIVIRQTIVGLNTDGPQSVYYGLGKPLCVWTALEEKSIDGYYTVRTADNIATYKTNAQVRSGANITKSILLGGTSSPAEFLLSYCKMFGLYMLYDNADKTINIVSRNTLYSPGGTSVTHDLEERIDRKSITITPYVLDSRWYNFALDVIQGEWAETYKGLYGVPYGQQRVNTGYSFDANSKEVLDGNTIKSATEVLEQNKYYTNIEQDNKLCPSVFLDGGKYTLWAADGTPQEFDITMPSTDLATIGYINTSYEGYDLFPKIQMHDSSGKALDGSGVLLFYSGGSSPSVYSRFCLTDDNSLMAFYNDGQPCWLLEQAASNTNYKISGNLRMPKFVRYYPVGGIVDASLDMGTPFEVNEPDINITEPDASTIYYNGWQKYITDRYDQDTRIVRCKVDFRGIGERVGQNLMRNFYFFDNSIWVLNKITNYSITTEDLVDCEFVKVKDKDNYNNGQTY